MISMEHNKYMSYLEFEKEFFPKRHQKRLDNFEKWRKESLDALFRRR